MKNIRQLLVVSLVSFLCVGVQISDAKTLFFDDFSKDNLATNYTIFSPSGKYVVQGGVLKQTVPNPGDPTYAAIVGKNLSEPITVKVKIRLDSWKDHDLSRAGIGFRLDPKDGGRGYAFLIHERLADKNMEFLNDAKAWAQQEGTSPVKVGTWYWMKAMIEGNNIFGQIWNEGGKEPTDWLMKRELNFGAVRPSSGNVGLNGGSASGANGDTTVSFDNFEVYDSTGSTVVAVEPKGKLSTAWGQVKVRY